MLNWLFGRLDDGFIVAECGEGLGDRMLALENALLLGRELGKRVYLGWPLNQHLRCEFGELFEMPRGGFEVLRYPAWDPFVVYRPIPVRMKKRHRAAGWWLNITCQRVLRRYRYGFDMFVHPRWGVPCDASGARELPGMPQMADLKRAKRIHIATSLNLLRRPDPPERRFDYLRPIAELRERIDEITGRFSRRTVGVHIRRGDRLRDPAWLRRHPLSEFVRLMREEIAHDEDVCFYLATESHTVISRLRVLFGERIVTQPGLVMGRGAGGGMKSAVVDMWALGRTRKIIGAQSQFMRAASRLEGAELQVVDVPAAEAGGKGRAASC